MGINCKYVLMYLDGTTPKVYHEYGCLAEAEAARQQMPDPRLYFVRKKRVVSAQSR